MLVLTRKLNEEICIGDNVTISVLKIKGNTVRIGVNAPREVRVLRGEIPRFDLELESSNDDEDAGTVDRSRLGFQHQPIVRDSKTTTTSSPTKRSSQLRQLVRQVVSAHAV